jgi:hypothetical protein
MEKTMPPKGKTAANENWFDEFMRAADFMIPITLTRGVLMSGAQIRAQEEQAAREAAEYNQKESIKRAERLKAGTRTWFDKAVESFRVMEPICLTRGKLVKADFP